jgi:hypothetical protein
VVDLMSALQESIERSKGRPRKSAARATAATKSSTIRLSDHREKRGLDAMSKADLMERAAKSKLAVSPKMTKPQLIALLSDSEKPAKKTTRR